MASVNKWIGIGRVGRDPELKHMTSGAVVNISIACDETYKNKDGEKVEKVEWVPLVFFGKLAEIVGEYVKKGSQVYVEGRLQTRKWQDKDGQDRYTTEVVADRMQMLGGRAANGNDPTPAAEANPKPVRAPSKFDSLEDSIPF